MCATNLKWKGISIQGWMSIVSFIVMVSSGAFMTVASLKFQSQSTVEDLDAHIENSEKAIDAVIAKIESTSEKLHDIDKKVSVISIKVDDLQHDFDEEKKYQYYKRTYKPRS